MTIEQRLMDLRKAVEEARAVPMSASCMLNRAETIDMIDAALRELPGELAAARAVVEERERERLRGKEQGDRIRVEAEEWAQATANNTEIVRRAERRANEILTSAQEEAAGLRAETDQYVDQRMAEFEAALQKTESQVKIMRARLASRSQLDGAETTVLPKI